MKFTGWVGPSGKRALLENAAVFALPSYDEGLPMSLLEAMAAGLPAVVSPDAPTLTWGASPTAIACRGRAGNAGPWTAIAGRARAASALVSTIMDRISSSDSSSARQSSPACDSARYPRRRPMPSRATIEISKPLSLRRMSPSITSSAVSTGASGRPIRLASA